MSTEDSGSGAGAPATTTPEGVQFVGAASALEQFDSSLKTSSDAMDELHDRYTIALVLFDEAKRVERGVPTNNAEACYYFRLARDACDAFTTAAVRCTTAMHDHIRLCRRLKSTFGEPTWRVPVEDGRSCRLTISSSAVEFFGSMQADGQPSLLVTEMRRLRACVRSLDESIAAREMYLRTISECERVVARKREDAVAAMAKYSDSDRQ